MRTAPATFLLLPLVVTGCLQISTTGFGDGGGTTSGGLAPGTPCVSNGVCNSEICGLAGTGNCCTTTCSAMNATCGATGCDDGGACLYPTAGIDCAPTFCSGHSEVQPQCDGLGGCSAESEVPCPNNLDCNDAGTACDSNCTSSTECAAGFSCNAGFCVRPEPVGSCTENDDCVSGFCGVDGTGYCCSTACSQAALCGASGCDPLSGACQYPDAGLVCGQDSCEGGLFQPAPTCELGSCQAGQPIDCAPYECNAGGCLTSCASNADCVQGYCDLPALTCCSLPSGGTIDVDSSHGNDLTPCCGTAGNGACQTISHVMQQIDEAQAHDVIIRAAVPSNGSWAPPGEVYPIVLGWGAELEATGVTFYDGDGGNRALFEIGPVSSSDHVGYASVVGGWFGGRTPSDQSTILVEPGSALYIASALVSSSLIYETTAIEVSAGGALIVGQDRSGGATGLVTVGPQTKDQNNLDFEGYNGIVCGSANGLGCTITDARLDAGSSLFVVNQVSHDIDAEEFSTITLTSAPRIGPAASGPVAPYRIVPTGISTRLIDGDLLRRGDSASRDGGRDHHQRQRSMRQRGLRSGSLERWGALSQPPGHGPPTQL